MGSILRVRRRAAASALTASEDGASDELFGFELLFDDGASDAGALFGSPALDVMTRRRRVELVFDSELGGVVCFDPRPPSFPGALLPREPWV